MAKSVNNKKEFIMSREEYIQHLSMRTNEIHMTTKNSKTGMGVIDLAVPTCCCREDAPCKKNGCYCMKGCQQIAVVQASYLRNLRVYNNDHEDFWNQVDFKLKHSGLGLCRFFDAGDIPDYDFFDGMVNIALKNPKIKFMAYVDFKDKSKNPEFPKNYTTCPNQHDKIVTCTVCQKCWNKKVKTVVFQQR